MRSCKKCGAELSAGLICPACGARNIPGSAPGVPPARPTAAHPQTAPPSPPPAAQAAPVQPQTAAVPAPKKAGGLRKALIALNCVLAVAVAGLAAVSILAVGEPASMQSPAGGIGAPAPNGGNGGGATPAPSVPDDVFVSLSSRHWGSSYGDGADTYFMLSRTCVLYRYSSGMEEAETIFKFDFVDPTNRRFMASAHNVKDVAPIGDTLYINLWSMMGEMPCHIMAAPLSGGEMELLFTLPSTTVMTASDGLLYCIWKRNLIVYDPVRGGEPVLHPLEIPINHNYSFAVIDGAVYYNGGYTDDAVFGLYRYTPETGVTEELAGSSHTMGMGGGVLVDGIYYYSDDDEMGAQYLVAHDIRTGTSNVLDVRMDAELMGMEDAFTGYHDGGIYYAANEHGEYNRYDIATGEIRFAYTVERTVPTDFALADNGPVTLRDETADYFISRENVLIDPATGKAVVTRESNITENTGITYERFLSQYTEAKQSFEADTLYIPGGKVLPLIVEEEE